MLPRKSQTKLKNHKTFNKRHISSQGVDLTLNLERSSHRLIAIRKYILNCNYLSSCIPMYKPGKRLLYNVKEVLNKNIVTVFYFKYKN